MGGVQIRHDGIDANALWHARLFQTIPVDPFNAFYMICPAHGHIGQGHAMRTTQHIGLHHQPQQAERKSDGQVGNAVAHAGQEQHTQQYAVPAQQHRDAGQHGARTGKPVHLAQTEHGGDKAEPHQQDIPALVQLALRQQVAPGRQEQQRQATDEQQAQHQPDVEVLEHVWLLATVAIFHGAYPRTGGTKALCICTRQAVRIGIMTEVCG